MPSHRPATWRTRTLPLQHLCPGLPPCLQPPSAEATPHQLPPLPGPHWGHRTHLSQCHTSLARCQCPGQLLPCPLDSLVRVTPRPLLGAHPEALPTAALEPLTSSGLKLAPCPPGRCFRGDPPPSPPTAFLSPRTHRCRCLPGGWGPAIVVLTLAGEQGHCQRKGACAVGMRPVWHWACPRQGLCGGCSEPENLIFDSVL